MTAAAEAPARPALPRASHLAPPLSFLRILRIELRHNAMPWILPLIAALFWFDSYRPSTATPALWVLRTFWNLGQGHTIIDFGPFVAGVAAWMGSRDGRRRTADLMTATARPRCERSRPRKTSRSRPRCGAIVSDRRSKAAVNAMTRGEIGDREPTQVALAESIDAEHGGRGRRSSCESAHAERSGRPSCARTACLQNYPASLPNLA